MLNLIAKSTPVRVKLGASDTRVEQSPSPHLFSIGGLYGRVSLYIHSELLPFSIDGSFHLPNDSWDSTRQLKKSHLGCIPRVISKAYKIEGWNLILNASFLWFFSTHEWSPRHLRASSINLAFHYIFWIRCMELGTAISKKSSQPQPHPQKQYIYHIGWSGWPHFCDILHPDWAHNLKPITSIWWLLPSMVGLKNKLVQQFNPAIHFKHSNSMVMMTKPKF